eukprot:gene1202-32544_t
MGVFRLACTNAFAWPADPRTFLLFEIEDDIEFRGSSVEQAIRNRVRLTFAGSSGADMDSMSFYTTWLDAATVKIWPQAHWDGFVDALVIHLASRCSATDPDDLDAIIGLAVPPTSARVFGRRDDDPELDCVVNQVKVHVSSTHQVAQGTPAEISSGEGSTKRRKKSVPVDVDSDSNLFLKSLKDSKNSAMSKHALPIPCDPLNEFHNYDGKERYFLHQTMAGDSNCEHPYAQVFNYCSEAITGFVMYTLYQVTPPKVAPKLQTFSGTQKDTIKQQLTQWFYSCDAIIGIHSHACVRGALQSSSTDCDGDDPSSNSDEGKQSSQSASRKVAESTASLPPPPVTPAVPSPLAPRQSRVIKNSSKRREEYLIRWTGYGIEQDTWESAKEIDKKSPQIVTAWLQRSQEDRDYRTGSRSKRKNPST